MKQNDYSFYLIDGKHNSLVQWKNIDQVPCVMISVDPGSKTLHFKL